MDIKNKLQSFDKRIFLSLAAVVVIFCVGAIFWQYREKPEIIEKPPKISLTTRYVKTGAAMRTEDWRKVVEADSDFIFEGYIELIRTKLVEENLGQVYTYSTVGVEHITKNTLDVLIVSPMTVVTPGGCVGDICEGFEEGPELHLGKYVQVYLNYSDGNFRVLSIDDAALLEEVAPCGDECPRAGARECGFMMSLTGDKSSGYTICGNYDSDSCLEWGEVIVCPSGVECINGTCAFSPPPK